MTPQESDSAQALTAHSRVREALGRLGFKLNEAPPEQIELYGMQWYTWPSGTGTTVLYVPTAGEPYADEVLENFCKRSDGYSWSDLLGMLYRIEIERTDGSPAPA